MNVSSEELVQEAQEAAASLQQSHQRIRAELRRAADVLAAIEERREILAAEPPGEGLDEVLRVTVRGIVTDAGLKQVALARKLDITPKHLSQMLTGRVKVSLYWAERIARVCGRELVITSRPIRGAGS